MELPFCGYHYLVQISCQMAVPAYIVTGNGACFPVDLGFLILKNFAWVNTILI